MILIRWLYGWLLTDYTVDEGSRVMVGCQGSIYSFLLIRDVCWRGRQCVCPTKQCFNNKCFVCNRVMGREIQVLVSMCWFAIYTGGNRTILTSSQHDIKVWQTLQGMTSRNGKVLGSIPNWVLGIFPRISFSILSIPFYSCAAQATSAFG